MDALDPGGFGALTITKAITLDGGAGQVASVLVGGTNGIVVAAGSTDDVILRNLSINGLGSTGSPGLNGVQFISGRSLRIQNLKIDGFSQNCINLTTATAASTVAIVNTVGTRCANGVHVASSPSVTTSVAVDQSRFLFNVTPSTPNNALGNGIWAEGTNSTVQVSNSALFGNTVGLYTSPLSGGISGNGTINSLGNNQVQGNTTNGLFTSTIPSN